MRPITKDNIPIPSGWRLVEDHEPIEFGDWCYTFYAEADRNFPYVGTTRHDWGKVKRPEIFACIRRLPAQGGYDSTADTLKHIKRVNELLGNAAQELIRRGQIHDNSKLEEPEKPEFDRLTPILKTLTYGSDEYKASLKELGVALTHHYKNNSHHPEHYANGVNDMDLFDLMEMFFDWKAASERTKGGNISDSIKVNAKRFNLSEQTVAILNNTVRSLQWRTLP